MTRHPAPRCAAPSRGSLLLPVAALALALSVSGCSRGDEPADAAPSTPAASPSAPADAAPTPSAAAPADPGPADPAGGSGAAGGASGGPAPAEPRDLTVALTFAEVLDGSLEVGAYVDGVIEDGGTCRLSATSGAKVREDAHDGVADATTTSCGTLTVPASTGTWSVVVSYSSPSGRGQATTSVVVP